MNKRNKLAAHLTTALAVAALFGTSAFAESRHHEGTHSSSGSQHSQSRSSSPAPSSGNWRGSSSYGHSYQQQGTRTYQQQSPRTNEQWSRGSYDNRTRVTPSQSYGRSYSDRGTDSYRQSYDSRSNWRGGVTYNGGQSYSSRGYSNRGYTSGRSYYGGDRRNVVGEGRVSRILHERGGYRVWLDGGRYAYWVPEARWGLYPLSVGLSIRFGGYWDPLGYWNVYDMGPRSGPYYTSGELRGVVESVDYRNGTLEIRDDTSGSFVTVATAGGSLGDIRVGDYVDINGAWANNGVFTASRIDELQGGGPGANLQVPPDYAPNPY